MPRLAVLALALAALSPPLSAQTIISQEFWTELEPIASAGGVELGSPSDAARRVLEEAAYGFGGMVYGFSFVYTPPDSARRVEEVFILEALGVLSWDSPALSAGTFFVEEGRAWLPVAYRPGAFEAARLESWKSAILERAEGRAGASILGGWRARFSAIEAAVKEALRAALRPLLFNKPREVRGRLAFARPPSMAIGGGSYHAAVRIAVEVLETLPYAF